MIVSFMSYCLRWWYKTYLRRVCACGHSLKAPSDPCLCVAGQALIIIHTGPPLQGKERCFFCSVFIYLWLAFFLWHPPRGVSVYSWTHRSNQSPLTVRKSMFNSLSPTSPKKQLFYFPLSAQERQHLHKHMVKSLTFLNFDLIFIFFSDIMETMFTFRLENAITIT